MLEGIIKAGLNVRFHTPNAIHIREISKPIAHLMFKAGFKTLRLGLETAAFNQRSDLDNKLTVHEFKRAVSYLADAGFNQDMIGAYLLIGLPGQDMESIVASIKTVKKNSFHKNEHIRKTEEFNKIFKNGRSSANEYTVMYVLDRKDSLAAKMGWVLSKKTGKANLRIKAKRFIREVFRLNKELLKDGLDIVMLPKKKITELKRYEEVEKMLLKFWKARQVLK